MPGDKSISHRALLAGACVGQSLRIHNLNPGRDVRATREALAALSVAFERDGDDVVVAASSRGGLRESPAPLDCMNSGSTARMLLGACAGANVRATFDGDDSLRRRPMEPVAAQLRAFGARIDTTDGTLPVTLHGTPSIDTRHFILLSPSAQVKSALLFAALYAQVEIAIQGDKGSRDHTERMLRHLGANIEWNGRTVTLGSAPLVARDIDVPGDPSSAAFFVTAAAIAPGSSVLVRDVCVNPGRTGLFEALHAMGANIEFRNERSVSGEPVADVAVEYAPLRPAAIDAGLALRAIDEIPLLAIAAAFAPGETSIAGVADLRTKESDRIAGIERLLQAVGIGVESERGTLRVRGGAPVANGAIVETCDDHRIAMAAAVLACAAGPIAIDSESSVDVSFPTFRPTLESVLQA
ncbi:MAG: 3-phosphoshikimate 1-carboxyvinyltransferase [Candidatus Eremiobacteraeota bacterium]|nr:3-phosphoshikimate 1-carboxyvinyltransferase [Candidatus Eremiobacteraeota bacterium]